MVIKAYIKQLFPDKSLYKTLSHLSKSNQNKMIKECQSMKYKRKANKSFQQLVTVPDKMSIDLIQK